MAVCECRKDTDRLSQHTGVGKYLLAVAECVALQCGFKEMAIISGVGVSTRHSQKQIENCLYWSNRIVLHI